MPHLINLAANFFGALLFGWFRWVGPWTAVTVSAVGVAVLALLVFKRVSNQSAIRRSRNRVVARVIEIVLYRENILGVFSNGGRILASFGPYLWHGLRPFLVLALPMALLLFQLAAWLEWQPVQPGESVVVTATLVPSSPVLDTPLSLIPAPPLRVDVGPVRVPAENLASWRVRSDQAGAASADLRVGESVVSQTLRAGTGLDRLGPRRLPPGAWRNLLMPAAPPLPADGPLRQVEILYARRDLPLGPFRVHWLVAFLVVTLAAGLAIHPLLGVEI